MNVADERWALDHRPSLFDHASRLHELTPDQPLPDGGRPYPDEAFDHDGRDDAAPPEAHKANVLAVLEAFCTDPGRSLIALHNDIRDLRFDMWRLDYLTLDHLPWLTSDLAHDTGIWLVRHSTDRLPAKLGLRLLAGRARAEDIPIIRTLGLLRYFGSAAVDLLETVPGAASALIWLAERSSDTPRSRAIAALCRLADSSTFPWLLRRAIADREEVCSYPRQLAETVSLADVLESETLDDEITLHTGKLLQALLNAENYSVQIRDFADACRAITGFAMQAAKARPDLDLLAAALTLAEDLRTGHAACLPWPAGAQTATHERLEQLIASARWEHTLVEARRSPHPITRWRAEWAAQVRRRVPYAPRVRPVEAQLNRLDIRIVVPDPILSQHVETRLLVDGRPVVAEAFRKGAPFGPEDILGPLLAIEGAREVRLAEAAYCGEGCCGALCVTISRDEDVVTWHNWSAPGGATLEAFHFHINQYEEAIAEASRDHSWEWSARRLARNLNRRLRDEPELLAAWGCETDDVLARTEERDRIRMSFWYPHSPSGLDDNDPWLQFEWVIPVDDMDLDGQVIRLADHLRRTDPKTHADLVGGSQEFADHFGFPWPY